MKPEKTTFAVVICNRGFFPRQYLQEARREMTRVLEELGHRVLMPDAGATRHGALETPQEGRVYAEFLHEHRGQYGGVILCLPNFGDENGAVAALRHVDVPILIQAYPDDLDSMGPEVRRDAFCGKFSIMDVLRQHGVRFTALKPHVVHPDSERFRRQVVYFDRLCRVVNGMRDVVVGAVGARTTAFKTVRIDEVALQRHGATMETFDLSDVFARMEKLDGEAPALQAKRRVLRDYTSWEGVPAEAFEKLARLGVILDELVEGHRLDCVALRCWLEMQEHMGISPCVLLGEMNNRGVVTACEVDVGNALTMHALHMASGDVATCLDWNNNYGDAEDRCILFHCGPVPRSMMTDPGKVVDHAILTETLGEGCSWGCCVGRIAATGFTFGSMMTEDGRVKTYLGEGEFTGDPIPPEFFGCAGVARIESLQDVLQQIGYAGHRHHTSVTPGHVAAPAREAFEKYLGYEVLPV